MYSNSIWPPSGAVREGSSLQIPSGGGASTRASGASGVFPPHAASTTIARPHLMRRSSHASPALPMCSITHQGARRGSWREPRCPVRGERGRLPRLHVGIVEGLGELLRRLIVEQLEELRAERGPSAPEVGELEHALVGGVVVALVFGEAVRIDGTRAGQPRLVA